MTYDVSLTESAERAMLWGCEAILAVLHKDHRQHLSVLTAYIADAPAGCP